MAFGINGFRCDECKAEWNLVWSTVTMTFPSTSCPNCSCDRTTRLPQTVPFARDSGMPPDFVYNCVCGKIFQKPPVDFNPYEEDPDKVVKQNIVECPYCKRTNNCPLGWYLP